MCTTIRWLPDYAVGVQEIDQEHQGLFSIAEKLQAAIRLGRGSGILHDLVKELVDYTCYHFGHEEELMQRINYPHYQDHCRQHGELRSRVLVMKERLQSKETTKEAVKEARMPNEVMHFLIDWLKCHTTTSDRRIGTYMRKCGLIS